MQSRARTRQNLQRQTIIDVTNRSPERHGSGVADQHVDREPFVLWPDFRDQNLHRLSANPLSSAIPDDKKLPEINLIWVFAIKRVGHGLLILIEERRPVFGGQPIPHALLQFL